MLSCNTQVQLLRLSLDPHAGIILQLIKKMKLMIYKGSVIQHSLDKEGSCDVGFYETSKLPFKNRDICSEHLQQTS